MSQELLIGRLDDHTGQRRCFRVFIQCQHPEDQWHHSEYIEWERLDPRAETRGQVIDRAVREHRENLAAEGLVCDCVVPDLRLAP